MSPTVIASGVSLAGSRPLWLIDSSVSPGLRYYFTYSIKVLHPRERDSRAALREQHFDQEVVDLCGRLADDRWTPEALIQHLDSIVHSQFAKAAVLNLFLAEVRTSPGEARFWFHGNYEAFLWNPEQRSISVPISHLPSLGLLSESLTGAHRPPGYVTTLSPNTTLAVWMLDQDYLHGRELGDLVKELWDHLLEGGEFEEFRKSILGRRPFSESLPLHLVTLTKAASSLGSRDQPG